MSINNKLDAMAERAIAKVTKDFSKEKKRTKRETAAIGLSAHHRIEARPA